MNEALTALADTDETLLLGFCLDESAATFELVCESWTKHPEASRRFSLFRFTGVEDFARTHGLYAPSRAVTTRFVSRDVQGTWVMQGTRNEQGAVEISFGHSYGRVAFRYQHLTHDVIDLYAKERGFQTWTYFVVGTKRAVDFDNPFDRPWARLNVKVDE